MKRDAFESSIVPWLCLVQTPGVGALSIARLLAKFNDSAQSILAS